MKIITTTKDGRSCTPVYIKWHYHGNVYFRKNSKTFKNKFFTITPCCLHVLGFRFTRSIGTIR